MRMRFLTVLAASVFVGLATGGPAKAELGPPLKQSCALVDAMTESPDAGLRYTRKLMEGIGNQKAEGLVQQLQPVVERREFVEGQVFSIGQLGDLTEEHLIAFRMGGSDTHYVRVVYETYRGKMYATNFLYQSSFAKIMQRNFLSGPVALSC